MKNSRSFAALVTLIVASLACTIGTAPETEVPDVITIVVTATSEEPVATEMPTETIVPTATEVPTETSVPATATSELLHFYVSGVVWHDMCNPPPGPMPAIPPEGCVVDQGFGGLTANGIYEAGEPGIEGVVVKLELDCKYGAFTTTTDANGNYSMSFTVPKSAGVTEQKICLSIDPLGSTNSSVLIPGGWTVPENGTALIQITIPVEQQNTINFGWDYQFQ